MTARSLLALRMPIAGLVLGLIALGGASPAAATSVRSASDWWYDHYGVPVAQSAGITGEGVKVAVIDGQIDPELPLFDGADLTVDSRPLCGAPAATTVPNTASFHGSSVTALLIGNGTGYAPIRGIAPRAAVTFFAIANSAGEFDCALSDADGAPTSALAAAIQWAVDDGNRIISISMAGPTYTTAEVAVVARAIERGVVIVAGQPNTSADAADRFPGDLNGVVAVNAIDAMGQLQLQAGQSTRTSWATTTVVAAGQGFPSIASGEPLTWSAGGAVTGSSLATPLVAGMLADVLQKYPKATGNQLLQSLIRSAAAPGGGLVHSDDGYGYGSVRLLKMLRDDPTTYPDVNPLLDKTGGLGVPTADQVRAAASSTEGRYVVVGTPTPREADPPVWILVVAAEAAVLLIALLVVVRVVRRRARARRD